MSSVASEASSLPSHAASAPRGAKARHDAHRSDGFAALMASHDEAASKPSHRAAPSQPRERSVADDPAAPSSSAPLSDRVATSEAQAPREQAEHQADAAPSSNVSEEVETREAASSDPAATAIVPVAAPAVAPPQTAGAACEGGPDLVSAEAVAGGAKRLAQRDAGALTPAAADASQGDDAAGDAAAGENAAAKPQTPQQSAKADAAQQRLGEHGPASAADKASRESTTDADALVSSAKAEPAPPMAGHASPIAHSANAAAAPLHAPASAVVSQPVPVNAIAIEIAGQARAGNSRFEIRLDPPELGRIDVRLDVDRDGNVTSRLVIERAETYDLLRRDQSTLERALQQAGLKTSEHSLEFSLRDQGFARQQPEQPAARGTLIVADAEPVLSDAAGSYGRKLVAGSGIDIRV